MKSHLPLATAAVADRGIAEPADRDHRHLDRLLHVGGKVEERRVRLGHRRDHAVRRGLGAVMTGGDMDGVGAGLRRPDRDDAAFAVGQPAVEEVLDRQPVDHAERRHRGFHRAQHVEAEAGAVLQRAAVFVGAAVLERRVELRDQVAVRGVDFDAVEAGLLRRAWPPRRSSPWSARCAPCSSPRGRWSRASSHRPDAESPTARPAARRRCRCGCGRRRGRAGSTLSSRRDGFRRPAASGPGMNSSW